MTSDKPLRIEKIGIEKRKEALELVLDVFMQYEAPDYTEEGVATFTSFICDESKMNALEMYGAYDHGKIAGVVATRNNGNHIALFFVDGKLHGQGIGRKLFAEVLRHSTADVITVNSSPFAVEVYQKLGFTATDREQLTDGIRYTPMAYTK